MQHISLFDYSLPEKCIAQEPIKQRDHSRLLVLNRKSDRLEHNLFKNIGKYFKAGDVLVLNNVRVVPARLYARRKTGGKIEVFVIDIRNNPPKRVLLKPMKRVNIGETLLLPDGWKMTVLKKSDQGCDVRFEGDNNFSEFIHQYGITPLPPYIHRPKNQPELSIDKDRYQTVFAKHKGAIAAPTAGLHFTARLLHLLAEKGIEIEYITLWVGWGTFKPVVCEFIENHVMEEEYFRIAPQTAQCIRNALDQNRKIVAVGTTTTRALESWARLDPNLKPVDEGIADIFIYPGYGFQIVQSLITNFHLPRSTLLMLVSAFAGRERVLRAYKIALQKNYRFFSYGDAMLIL